MSNFHSTVTRRDFMKALGIGAAGLGAAASAAPIFHDLDEVTSSPNSTLKRPWWVKERDFKDITTEYDLDLMDLNRPDMLGFGHASPYPGFTAQQLIALRNKQMARSDESLRDVAITESTNMTMWTMMGVLPDVVNQQWGGKGPDFFGVPRWEASPEENLKTIRAAYHYFGAPETYVFEMDDEMQKLNRVPFVWDDVEVPTPNPAGGLILPKDMKYGVIAVVKQNLDMHNYGLATTETGYEPRLSHSSDYIGYADLGLVSLRAAFYLRALGYQVLQAFNGPAGMMASLTPPFSPFCGMGEHSRANVTCHPDYGLSIRRPVLLFTILPLEPTHQIDAGLWRFCHECGKCADSCPPGGLSKDKEPSWEPITYNGEVITYSGTKSFKNDYSKVVPYGCPTDCRMCMGMCPFNHPNTAMIHPIIRATAANTSAFNGFFATMDEVFYPLENWSIEDWWNRDLKSWDGDALVGFGSRGW